VAPVTVEHMYEDGFTTGGPDVPPGDEPCPGPDEVAQAGTDAVLAWAERQPASGRTAAQAAGDSE
jgi:hypothetical protein